MPRRELLWSLLVGAAAAVLSWVRLDPKTRGVVWAEDGWFLQNRIEDGPLQSILDPYEGYLHVLPRIIVDVSSLVPLADYAVAVTALCCLTVGAVAGLTYLCSRDVVASRAARVALGLVPALVPTAAAEVLGNTANLHWYLLWLTPWLLLFRPTSKRQAWALAVLMLVVTLSEIQALYFLPLALLGLRDRRRLPMRVTMALGIAVQLVMALTDDRKPDEGTPALLDLVQGYGLHVFLQQLYPGTYGVGDVLVERGWFLVVLASLPFLLVLAALVVTTRGRDRLLTATVLVGALAPYVVAMVLNFKSFLAFDDFDFETLAIFAPLRYTIVPAMFVLAAAVVVADRLFTRPSAPPRVLGVGLLAAVIALGLWHLDAGPTKRTRERGWADDIERAVARCDDTGLAIVEIKTSPESWEVFLECAEVLDRTGRR